MRLNPHYPFTYLFFLDHAYRLLGRYKEAIAAQKRALTRNPDFLYAHLCRLNSIGFLGGGWFFSLPKKQISIIT
jgi:tetratricopeptide (TPR) repeat protein